MLHVGADQDSLRPPVSSMANFSNVGDISLFCGFPAGHPTYIGLFLINPPAPSIGRLSASQGSVAGDPNPPLSAPVHKHPIQWPWQEAGSLRLFSSLVHAPIYQGSILGMVSLIHLVPSRFFESDPVNTYYVFQTG